MPRRPLPLAAADLSAFARSLRRQLGEHLETHRDLPGHVALLNMLARAAGHRNLQSLHAAAAAAPDAPAMRDAAPAAAPALPAAMAPLVPVAHARGAAAREQLPPTRGPRDPALPIHVDRALRQFDGHGRLMRWPSRYATQRLALWALWERFDPARPYREREVNALLNAQHLFGDHCTLRRELVNMKLLGRTPDGREYRMLPADPDADASLLLQRLKTRRAAPIA
jgi:hypothetical protein